MPDVLLWLGIRRIDWLLSMSSDKYDAITAAGIEVMQRVSLPDAYVPPAAVVEITAKISAGYHSEAITDHEDVANELRNLSMVRERCGQVFELAKAGKSKHFNVDLERLDHVTEYVWDVTTATYGSDVSAIPYHSRWRHFAQQDVEAMKAHWHCDALERCRRLIDLATISVLLDAGAGPTWQYRDDHGHIQERSEGLAIATFDMFKEGIFSSDAALPHRVNGVGLKHLSLKTFSRGLQVTENNVITGLEGRFKLVKRIGKALESHPKYAARTSSAALAPTRRSVSHGTGARVCVLAGTSAMRSAAQATCWTGCCSTCRWARAASARCPSKRCGRPSSWGWRTSGRRT